MHVACYHLMPLLDVQHDQVSQLAWWETHIELEILLLPPLCFAMTHMDFDRTILKWLDPTPLALFHKTLRVRARVAHHMMWVVHGLQDEQPNRWHQSSNYKANHDSPLYFSSYRQVQPPPLVELVICNKFGGFFNDSQCPSLYQIPIRETSLLVDLIGHSMVHLGPHLLQPLHVADSGRPIEQGKNK